MSEILHHIPGRLRIRSRYFRPSANASHQILRRLRTIDGVTSVRLNKKASSATINYDTDSQAADLIKVILQESGFEKPIERPAPTRPRVSIPPALQSQIFQEVKKVAVNTLVSRGVSFSLASLLGPKF